jgi:perosamine synthetase
MTRREAVAAAAAGVTLVTSAAAKPAALGGDPVRKKPFPGWPIVGSAEREGLQRVVNSGKWYRGNGKEVARFEEKYAELIGTKHCLAVANGTSALMVALHGLDVQAGDEVIVPPYTFIATINAVISKCALPVFVDTDAASFQMDPSKIAAAVTDRTVAVIPVHIGGTPADLDGVMAAAKPKGLKVLEDAAQAHLAEWKGKRVGTIGDCGTFSFQASKNLNSGEGGAVVSNDGDFIERCYAYHTNSNARRPPAGSSAFMSGWNGAPTAQGANLRLTEFQASLLLAQMERLEAQSKRRDENAAYLTQKLQSIPGISPAAMPTGATRSAWHLYMFRYDAAAFAGLDRAGFLKALAAEGIPASGGYAPLNRQPFLENILQSRGYQRIYGAARLKQWREQNTLPANDKLCQEAVWFTQTMLLGDRSDMDDILNAIGKIHQHAAALATSSRPA